MLLITDLVDRSTRFLTFDPGQHDQMLTLVARSTDDIGGVSGQIDRILIRPARSPATGRTAS